METAAMIKNAFAGTGDISKGPAGAAQKPRQVTLAAGVDAGRGCRLSARAASADNSHLSF
jgi:hypothetical protein